MKLIKMQRLFGLYGELRCTHLELNVMTECSLMSVCSQFCLRSMNYPRHHAFSNQNHLTIYTSVHVLLITLCEASNRSRSKV